MSRLVAFTLTGAVLVTLGAFGVWAATDRHYYTKFEVVEQVEVAVDPDDPFADTGLFDDEIQTETVSRDEFHLGLLPVPQGIFDKHALSVTTLVVPVWVLVLAALWRQRLHKTRRQDLVSEGN